MFRHLSSLILLNKDLWLESHAYKIIQFITFNFTDSSLDKMLLLDTMTYIFKYFSKRGVYQMRHPIHRVAAC